MRRDRTRLWLLMMTQRAEPRPVVLGPAALGSLRCVQGTRADESLPTPRRLSSAATGQGTVSYHEFCHVVFPDLDIEALSSSVRDASWR